MYVLLYFLIIESPKQICIIIFFRVYKNSKVYLESRKNPRSEGTFLADASFYLRRGKWFENTVSFESYNKQGHFLSKLEDSLVLAQFDDTKEFKPLASFTRKCTVGKFSKLYLCKRNVLIKLNAY